jgi:hypothetical protein
VSARDSLERETPDTRAPDVPREASEVEGPVEHRQGEVLKDSTRRCEASAEYRQRVEGNEESRPFEAPRTELARFDLRRAGLPDTSIDFAAEYVAGHRQARPWLGMADGASPEARRIIAAMDGAGGHGHIRHEGWVTEEANRRRVIYTEDPAQLDPEKQQQGIDGLRLNDRRHRCADIATRITDPDAFATAFARGAEHPKVRKALEMAFNTADKPEAVTVPIADLLGPEGHRYCTGWRLKPVDGSAEAAYIGRRAWLDARAKGTNPDAPEPEALPVPTFKEGVITFMFSGNETERRYEIATMRPDPPEESLQRGV